MILRPPRFLSDCDRADIVDYYDSGKSYDACALKFGISSTAVQRILEDLSPDLIRRRGRQVKLNPKPAEEWLTLVARGLYAVGAGQRAA